MVALTTKNVAITAALTVASVTTLAVCIIKVKFPGFSFAAHARMALAKRSAAAGKKDGTIRPVSTLTKRGYTKEELAKFTGENNTPILLSLKRKVYEVAPHFYGPGMHYHVFAGKESSRPLAKSQLSDEEANKYWADCNEEELATLEDYVTKFDAKYPVVGWFVPDESFYDIPKAE